MLAVMIDAFMFLYLCCQTLCRILVLYSCISQNEGSLVIFVFQPLLCLYYYFVFVRVPTKMKMTPPFHILLWKYIENRFIVLFRRLWVLLPRGDAYTKRMDDITKGVPNKIKIVDDTMLYELVWMNASLPHADTWTCVQ